MTNVIPFIRNPDSSPTRAEKVQAGSVYYLVEGMARRMRFLLDIYRVQNWKNLWNGHSIVRKRTIDRCKSVIDRKWDILASQLWELRTEQERLDLSIKMYVYLLERRFQLPPQFLAEYRDKLLETPQSSKESKLICDLLFWFGLTLDDIVHIIHGFIPNHITTTEDDAVYKLMRRLHSDISKK